ncbi:DNA polymerase I [Clostridium grantii]|uniref:DNA polymerase I n=1 Tax=Clostridium grantii DSM 8605 TaxID=1121316 RepID=A0A1M5X3N7_9CLOT|nr:DNA polymerase I [Clostridium grantii]SHH94158.1 DNA polymerase I [Clostridium grantii DSM 8605]
MNKEKLLILDGHSLMYRAFFGLPQFTNSEGLHTNAIYGFINMMLKIKDEIKPDYIVTAFDKKAPTFRQKDFAEYKAGREKMPSELREQFPILKEILKDMAINIFEIDGFEADDIIGTLSVYAEENNIEVYIVTGDRDALQLATDNVKIVINKKGMTDKTIYDRNKMIEEYGVTPIEFIDCKGLMGDKSDNIPGVPGVGEKTAFKLIKEYGCIEKVLEDVENIKGKKLKENLIEYAEQAILSKRLATIVTNVPIEMSLEDIKSKEDYDVTKVKETFKKLEFKSLLSRFESDNKEDSNDIAEIKPEENSVSEIDVEISIKKVQCEESLMELTEKIKDFKGVIFVSFFYNDENFFTKSDFTKIYLKFEEEYYEVNKTELNNLENGEKIKIKFKKLAESIFQNTNIKIISHGTKNAYKILRKIDVDFNNCLFDMEIAAYLLEPARKSYDLLDLLESFYNEDLEKFVLRNTKDKDLDEEAIITRNENREILTIKYMDKLYEYYLGNIKEKDMNSLYFDVEHPLIKVLGEMEANGFRINEEILNDLGVKLSLEIEKVEKEIYDISEEKFNINSPKQLGKILFEKLDLPVIKKTKTGYSTNAEVLEKLRDKHPIIDKISHYRQITKLNSTYVEGLKNVIEEDGKIHTTFNQTVTTTGRLSSTEPNLQNIPIKYELGREVRKVFVSDNPEDIILSADYSQIELRVLAHISEDENFIDAFVHHSDIHRKTAAEVFKVPYEEVTSKLRSNAKAVNFGIVYGIGPFSLSEDLNISRKEAKEYIETYFERYPKIKGYFDNVIKNAIQDGYVTTILNRRRLIPEIQASSKIVKAFGERLAMNTPIQGSAADIIKLAMIKVYHRLSTEKLESTLLLQVHDELILNVKRHELEKVKDIVKVEMENVIKLSVPLEVDMNTGENWYETK